MKDMWTYTKGHAGPETHIVGYRVEAIDGTVGTIDEATYDAGSSYVIIDTGRWIFGRVVLLPAGIITAIDHADNVVQVSRTKAEIKAAPKLVRGHEPRVPTLEPHAEYYRSMWTEF